MPNPEIAVRLTLRPFLVHRRPWGLRVDDHGRLEVTGRVTSTR
jgi:hypothetical protein